MITEIREKGKSGFCDLISKLAIIAREYKSVEDVLNKTERIKISKSLKNISFNIDRIYEVIEPLMH